MLEGYVVRSEGRGTLITVPKGAKAAGVSGSGWRVMDDDGLMEGSAIFGVSRSARRE